MILLPESGLFCSNLAEASHGSYTQQNVNIKVTGRTLVEIIDRESHSRRIKTEEKAKVVADAWGGRIDL